jgi:hypothetical protein
MEYDDAYEYFTKRMWQFQIDSGRGFRASMEHGFGKKKRVIKAGP